MMHRSTASKKTIFPGNQISSQKNLQNDMCYLAFSFRFFVFLFLFCFLFLFVFISFFLFFFFFAACFVFLLFICFLVLFFCRFFYFLRSCLTVALSWLSAFPPWLPSSSLFRFILFYLFTAVTHLFYTIVFKAKEGSGQYITPFKQWPI